MNGHIDVWTVRIDCPETAELCRRYLSVLSAEEQKKASRYLREADRIRSITGRLMVRTLASKLLGRADIGIVLSEYGKPYIDCENAFRFSLSHSGCFVILAAGYAEVGADIEQIKHSGWQDIIPLLAPNERQIIEASERPEECFYRIWTVREAFAKQTGIGLSLFEDGRRYIDYEHSTAEYRRTKMFISTFELEGHTLSICSEYRENPRLCQPSREEIIQLADRYLGIMNGE